MKRLIIKTIIVMAFTAVSITGNIQAQVDSYYEFNEFEGIDSAWVVAEEEGTHAAYGRYIIQCLLNNDVTLCPNVLEAYERMRRLEAPDWNRVVHSKNWQEIYFGYIWKYPWGYFCDSGMALIMDAIKDADSSVQGIYMEKNKGLLVLANVSRDRSQTIHFKITNKRNPKNVVTRDVRVGQTTKIPLKTGEYTLTVGDIVQPIHINSYIYGLAWCQYEEVLLYGQKRFRVGKAQSDFAFHSDERLLSIANDRMYEIVLEENKKIETQVEQRVREYYSLSKLEYDKLLNMTLQNLIYLLGGYDYMDDHGYDY